MEVLVASDHVRKAWLALRKSLWPEYSEEQLMAEINDILSDETKVAYLLQDSSLVIGFAEASLKPFTQICRHQPNAFFEGWYVVGSFRKQGGGRLLMKAIETWAKEKNCKELVSDTTDEYPISPAVHKACGFSLIDKKRLLFLKQLL